MDKKEFEKKLAEAHQMIQEEPTLAFIHPETYLLVKHMKIHPNLQFLEVENSAIEKGTIVFAKAPSTADLFKYVISKTK